MTRGGRSSPHLLTVVSSCSLVGDEILILKNGHEVGGYQGLFVHELLTCFSVRRFSTLFPFVVGYKSRIVRVRVNRIPRGL